MPKISAEYRDGRRAHILAAARECFARDGFVESSMSDLVRETGMSSGAIYRYFPSKDAVIAAIAAENLDELDTLLREAVTQTANPVAAMAVVLETIGKRHATDGFAQIALQVWSRATQYAEIEERLALSMRGAAGLLADVKGSEVPDGPEREYIARLLLCILPGYVLGMATVGPDVMRSIPDTLLACAQRSEV